MSGEKIKKLVHTEGKTRTLEMYDGSVIEREGGSVSWRNNNPGNLKFAYAGSADRTDHAVRTKEQALADAQKRYRGVVGLDQWGNAVFESYEAGRVAKAQLLERKHGEKTVEEMLRSYSTPDYSGQTNHRAQADFIYAEGERHGVNLRAKKIGAMNAGELAALADGIKGFEGWRVGKTRVIQAPSAQIGARPEAQPAQPLASTAIYVEAHTHFFAGDLRYEYGRPDLPRPGRDTSRLERDLDGDGRKGVDCSAFLWRGLKNAGYDVSGENAAAFTTQTLFNGASTTAYARRHFDVVSAAEARRPGGNLQPGDILMFSSKGGQHVGIFKGYDADGQLQFIGSQSSTGPAEVTVRPGGYWDGASTHIVGALRAKPEFQVRAPLHAGNTQLTSREVATSAPPLGRSEEAILGRGDKGQSVSHLQQQLHRLGYTSAEGPPLMIASDFGRDTDRAVRAFQRAHGLQVDGVVGKETREALAKAERTPLLSEKTHPNHSLFQEAQQGLRQLPPGILRNPDELNNTAATLAQKARESGIFRIDHVLMNTRGDRVIAVQGDPQDPTRNFVAVDKVQAASQSLEQSTAHLLRREIDHQQLTQAQVRAEHVEHRSGLVLGIRP
jgi:cell wall-associated NlpC family hydrolase